MKTTIQPDHGICQEKKCHTSGGRNHDRRGTFGGKIFFEEDGR
jgi:hypothetical protein